MSIEDRVSPTAAPPEPTDLDALRTLIEGTRVPRRPGPVSTSLTFGWRAMLKIKHVPEQLFDVTVFPAIMTLMFTHLFGGALAGSTEEYLQFLLPGMIVMSVMMTTMYTGTALNIDVHKGIFDRFRTLPIWRPSALVGALLGDLARYTMASVVMVGLGLAMGYRPDGGALGVLGALGLLLVFSFSFSWIWTMFGLLMRSEKSVQSVSFAVVFPLVFTSNVFVDPDTMPGWLRACVEVSPITHMVDAERALMDGTSAAGPVGWVLLWSAALTLVFGVATMRLYNGRR
ncbi:ABC transporter permease [Streptomyces radicis]|uniref:Transport permease protein n=1 Tax=Streptomyces radicis TaxID=1750517 RepID=A0A3A9WUS8_9ACTN|nr:ABC transporter permease [Streptomyces radicis]RKN11556.1 ABC transporter permease [Streptomyces radicis]RKN26426.1 ABC transporter permease [Streptomyces radicis]